VRASAALDAGQVGASNSDVYPHMYTPGCFAIRMLWLSSGTVIHIAYGTRASRDFTKSRKEHIHRDKSHFFVVRHEAPPTLMR
jgi:hypothetical protein